MHLQINYLLPEVPTLALCRYIYTGCAAPTCINRNCVAKISQNKLEI